MEFMNPHYLWLLLALPVYFAVWFYWGRRSHTLKNTQVSRVRVSTKAGAALTGLIWLSKGALWASLVLGLAGTVFPFNKVGTDSAGVIYMTIDTSGSTKIGGVHFPYENWLGYYFDKRTHPDYKPPTANPEDAARAIQPVDTELGAAKMFIEHAGGLRIGLTVFDTKFFYTYPATKTPEVAISVLDQIRTYTDKYGGGTNFDGPVGSNANDGALQGALRVFNKEDGNATRIYIMVTDGMASIDEGRAKELAAAYKELGIHFFVFGVDKPWTDLSNSSLQPIIKFAQSVDGTVVRVQDEAAFKASLTQIEALARASVRTVYTKERQDSLLMLLAVAALSFAVWIGLSVIRRSPL
jgi:hypothetical protein